MGGVRLTVCLPAEAREDLGAALTSVLEPFGMDTSGTFERAWWENWSIRGGSDACGFVIAPGHEGDPRLVHDEPLYDGTLLPSLPGRCAGGPRSLLDFDGPMAVARGWAMDTWDLWERLAAEHPPYVPWSAFEERIQPWSGVRTPEWDRASQEFETQPILKAFRTQYVDEIPTHLGFRPPRGMGNPHRWGADRSDFVERTCSTVVSLGTDLLTLDGWWIQPDGNAMHAACDDAWTCGHRSAAAVPPNDHRFYVSAPDDILLIRVRCRI